jgi:tRNA A37 methylthiotransferase MiaB
LKSKPLRDILDEFTEGINRGRKYFFLVTEDSGCYGLDLGITVIDLLRQIFDLGKGHDYKLVISNFNARWLVEYYDDLERILIENADKIHYLQIPVQSASDRILKLMNRAYGIEAITKCLLKLRHKIPALALTTDMIAGFPDEQEEDFIQSRDFLKKIQFSHVDVFAFQDRKGTQANKMANKVSQDIIELRVMELVKVQAPARSYNSVIKKAVELINDYK